MLRILPMLALVACANAGYRFDDADLEDPDTVRDLARFGSAANLFTLPFYFMPEDADNPPACPILVRSSGADATWEGGCTDEQGVTWHGRLRTHEHDDGSYTLRLNRWGRTQPHPDCPGFAGELLLDGHAVVLPDPYFVSLDVRGTTNFAEDGCAEPSRVRIEYVGEDTPSGLNGAGFIAHERLGEVEVETVDEVVEIGMLVEDPICEHEALSGQTFLRTDAHEAVITYDGATDCDPESTVTWTLDGAPQGELSGIACSISAVPVVGGPVALLAGLLLLGRRRPDPE